MATPQTTDKPKTTRHRINEVPGRTTPAPGQPEPEKPKRQAKAPKGKTAEIINTMRRPEGATMEDIIAITGWQKTSARAFISRNLKGKEGIDIQEKSIGRRKAWFILQDSQASALDDIPEAI